MFAIFVLLVRIFYHVESEFALTLCLSKLPEARNLSSLFSRPEKLKELSRVLTKLVFCVSPIQNNTVVVIINWQAIVNDPTGI